MERTVYGRENKNNNMKSATKKTHRFTLIKQQFRQEQGKQLNAKQPDPLQKAEPSVTYIWYCQANSYNFNVLL